MNPYAEYAYDGITLNPMEVLFPKVKGFTIDGEWTTPRMAAAYDRWMTHQVMGWHRFNVFVYKSQPHMSCTFLVERVDFPVSTVITSALTARLSGHSSGFASERC